MLQNFRGTLRLVNAVAIGINGEIISGSNDKSIKVWDGKDFKLLKTLDQKNGGHSDYVCSLAISDNGRIASGSVTRPLRCGIRL
jgi:WD40 repeat protein